MKTGLLFLTYGNPIHSKTFIDKGFLSEPDNEIIIHAKFPENLDSTWSKYESKLNIKTTWGSETIAVASLILIEEAYEKGCDWFILCSEDSYPLMTWREMVNDLTIHKKSMFHVLDAGKDKTSQWWAINRADAESILTGLQRSRISKPVRVPSPETIDVLEQTTYLKNLYSKELFVSVLNNIPAKAAVDELFFLSLLKIINRSYTFDSKRVHYVKWISQWVSKHPVIFNNLLPVDKSFIKTYKSYFIRKTFPSFEAETIKPKQNAIVVTLGSENIDKITDYSELISKIEDYDLYLLLMIDNSSKIPDKLKERCVQCFSVVWNMVDKAYDSVAEVLPKYASLIVVRENENANKVSLTGTQSKAITEVQTAPIMQEKKQNKKNERTEKLSDKTKDYKIAFLFLLRGDINHPKIWEKYFAEKYKSNVSFYVHSKEPTQVSSFLKPYIIKDLKETGWGYIVNAYFSLFCAAMSDTKNMKFVTISESCLPTENFHDFHQFMNKSDYRESFVHFMPISSYDRTERIQTQHGYESMEPFTKHYARMCLSRYHVEKLLAQPQERIQFFVDMHVGDEFFLTLINAEKDKDFITDYIITYDNWDDVKSDIKKLKDQIKDLETEKQYKGVKNDAEIKQLKEQIEEIGKNPKTYTSIEPRDIQNALQSGAFFWRKFPATIDMKSFYTESSALKKISKKGGTIIKRKSRKIIKTKPKRRTRRRLR